MESDKRNTRLWNRRYTSATIGGLLIGITMFMTSSIMSKYVNATFGSVALTGALNAAFSVCAIVARIASGGVSDHRGAGWTMIVGSILLAVSTFAFGIVPVIAGIVVLRGLQGAGFAFASTGAYAVGTRAIPEGKMETGTSFLSMGASLATMLGPVIALALVFGDDFTPSFTVAALLSLAAAVLALLFLRGGQGASQDKDEQSARQGEEPRGFLRFIEPKSVPTTVCQLFNYLAQTAVNVYIVVWAEATGIGNGAAFFAVMAIAMCVVRFFSGQLMTKLGAIRTAIGSSVLSGLAYVLLLFCSSDATFLLSACLLSIGQGVFIACIVVSIPMTASLEKSAASQATGA